MAESDSSTSDELLAVAIASGQTTATAAKNAGMSERTAYRRLREPQFRASVQEQRRQMVDGAVGRMANSLASSAEVLQRLLASHDERIQLQAASKTLTLGIQMIQFADLEARMTAMEKGVEVANHSINTGEKTPDPIEESSFAYSI